jgi:hypothetical protein
MPTWLEEVAEQRENTRCVVCGEPGKIAIVRSRPDLDPPEHTYTPFCTACDIGVANGYLRKETGQDDEGSLVDRWRRWEKVWVPGELLPLPKS